MNSQLKVLISLCEEEKLRLVKLINDCLAEEEYLLAHYHSNALYQLNGRLRTFNNIEDNNYDDKQFKLRRISILQKHIQDKDSESMKRYFHKESLEAKETLGILNQTQPKKTNNDTTLLLDNILTRLLGNEVKSVKLILKREDDFFLAFSFSNKTLKVTLPHLRQHIKKRTLYVNKVEELKNLGFDIPENGNRLVMVVNGDKQSILSQLNITLSKIVFEIFYYKEFDNKSYIQFTEKASR